MSKLRVLFLTLWYPHRYDAMDGLFVRKHAEAVGRLADVEVLYFHSDSNIRKFELVENDFNGVHEVVVYFPKFGPPVIRQIVVAINYWRAFRRGLKKVRKPDITQINVLEREGLCALWLKKLWRVPYVAIEHWSGYLPQNFSYRGFFHKRMIELIARNASVIMPISRPLGERMQELGIKCNRYEQIDNVVDDFFYASQNTIRSGKKRILSVTCFSNRPKNLIGLLNVVKELASCRSDFELVMVGTGIDYQMVVEHAVSLGLPSETVRFVGEQTPQEVSSWMSDSDFLVMFSNYENAPCVISEALASGKPVVSSKVGGIADMIPDFAGILVEPRNEKQLLEALDKMLDDCRSYDSDVLRQLGQKYSYSSVGEKLMGIYQEVLNNQL